VTSSGLFFPFLLVLFSLCCPHLDDQSRRETRTGYGGGEVKEISIMAETDLEKRVLKLYTVYTL
jgi:hypothetical protein